MGRVQVFAPEEVRTATAAFDFDDISARVELEVAARTHDLLEHSASTLHARLRAGEREAGALCIFALRHTLNIDELEGLRILVGKQPEHRTKPARDDLVRVALLDLLRGDPFGLDIWRVRARMFLTERPMMVDDDGPRNAKRPAGEALLVAQIAGVLVHPHQDVLHEIVDVLGAHAPADITPQRDAKREIYRFKRARTPLLDCGHAQHEGPQQRSSPPGFFASIVADATYFSAPEPGIHSRMNAALSGFGVTRMSANPATRNSAWSVSTLAAPATQPVSAPI